MPLTLTNCSRLERAAKSSAKHRPKLFAEKTVFVNRSTLPKIDLERLLLQCGADVVPRMEDAEVIIGDEPMTGVRWKVVTDKWILDSIAQHKTLPVAEYLA